jgi:RNAse (barnase) inhibitor barstar
LIERSSGGEPECGSGVYLIDATRRDELLHRPVTSAGPSLVILDGEAVTGRDAFFRAIARSMSFPDYFGQNWDAVYDCLTDPSVLPADGAVLVLNGFDAMATREPEQWKIALKVLRDACAFWRPLSRDLFVLLVGEPELAPGIPPLPNRCLDA